MQILVVLIFSVSLTILMLITGISYREFYLILLFLVL